MFNPFRRAFWFGETDGRAASLFRIVFGLLVLKEVLYFIPIAGFFYSDSGVYPVSILESLEQGNPTFTLLRWLTAEWQVVLFFSVWALIVLALVLGYRTRLMTVLNYLLWMSVMNRNFHVTSGADTAIQIFTFWLMFINTNGYYSLDSLLARLNHRPPPPKTIPVFPVRMLQLQIAIIYFYTGVFKAFGVPWREGTAMAYILQLDAQLLPPGVWFRALAPDWLLTIITHGTVIWELAFPLFMFSPFWQPKIRILGLIPGFLMHLGIALMFVIPTFSWVMISSYIIYFESSWVERGENAIRRWLLSVDSVRRWTHERRWVRLALTRDRAQSRGVFAYERYVLPAIAALGMVGVIWYTAASTAYVTETDRIPFPDSVRSIVRNVGLAQVWALFAPQTPAGDGWLIVPGTFEDGTVLELRSGNPPSDDMIRPVFGPWVRWEKYQYIVLYEEMTRQNYASYLCRAYNSDPQRPRLTQLEIIWHYRAIHKLDQPPNLYVDDLLMTYNCDESRIVLSGDGTQ